MGIPSYFLTPNWPAPKRVKALMTLKPFGDVLDSTTQKRLVEAATLPQNPVYLQQIHTTELFEIQKEAPIESPTADASFTFVPNQVCVVKTADCLPVLLCDDKATVVSAVHCGWRSLAGGILEKTIDALSVNPNTLMAWLGPCIGPKQFEVGEEVYQAFIDREGQGANKAFIQNKPNHWLADLQSFASMQLNRLGIHNLYSDKQCTYTDADTFYSYRLDPKNSGRMASLIWFE